MSLKKSILIVEDNEINRGILSSILSDHYCVYEAENGQEGLDILAEKKDSIALILLDIVMPVMDGYTFLDRIKADAQLSTIPVIVVTQSDDEEGEVAALDHGATDFVPKPYSSVIILHRVAALIKLRETAAMVNQLQYDRLTGLYSKEFFFQKVRERLAEDPDGKYSIVCSNVENFKLINDIFGQEEGNRLLKDLAANIRRFVFGQGGFCGRFEADRFVCFQKSEDVIRERVDFGRLRETGPLAPMKNVTVRWGIYEITDPAVPVEQMCDRAILAEKSIKRQYNRFYADYDDSLRDKLLRERAITCSMETALQRGQFEVYFQPQYSLKTGSLSGAEALVRWNHPEWGMVSPGEFIPLFEKNSFITKLDEYVWEKVCIQLKEWEKKGYPALPVSVNVSRADIFQGDLVVTLTALVKKYGVDVSRLHLEVTESMYSEQTDQVIHTVAELKRLGFVVEMDDFGSGYSSLNMFSQIAVDTLKLDVKFIQNEVAKPVTHSLLSDMIHMAHRMGLSVIAEGVETREQLERLRGVDCDHAQGYYFARPMPAPAFEQLLQAWKPQTGDGKEHPHRQSDLKQETVFLIDEDDGYRTSVKKEFLERYYGILEAKNAEEGLKLIASGAGNSVSAVVLSMTLPDNGAEKIFAALRGTPAFWETPVLATLPNGTCLCEYPLALETDDFLCKCHPIADLHRRIRRNLDAAFFHRKERLLQEEANHDHLTGLMNRRGLQGAMDRIHEADFPVAVCLFDLDDMKKVNDTYGHEMGDRMLRFFAELLGANTETEDVTCRYGGDEFVLLLKHVSDPSVAQAKCEEICRLFYEKSAENLLQSACSAGIFVCRSDNESFAEHFRRADKALYRAKRENKGSCYLMEE